MKVIVLLPLLAIVLMFPCSSNTECVTYFSSACYYCPNGTCSKNLSCCENYDDCIAEPSSPPSLYYCDTSTHTCINVTIYTSTYCTSNSSCVSAYNRCYYCSSNYCRKVANSCCSSNNNCSVDNGKYCNNQYYICYDSCSSTTFCQQTVNICSECYLNYCRGNFTCCKTSADCDLTCYCNTINHSCTYPQLSSTSTTCSYNSTCSSNYNICYFCYSGYCYKSNACCTSSLDCGTGYNCSSSTNLCVANSCTYNSSYCSSAYNRCYYCSSGSCIFNSSCCASSSNCSLGYYCGSSYTCISGYSTCTSNSDCSSQYNRCYYCSSGSCTLNTSCCTSNSDCNSSYTCSSTNYTCVLIYNATSSECGNDTDCTTLYGSSKSHCKSGQCSHACATSISLLFWMAVISFPLLSILKCGGVTSKKLSGRKAKEEREFLFRNASSEPRKQAASH